MAFVESSESTVLKFIRDFFSCFDTNRHIVHTLFSEDGTLVIFGNRVEGQQSIKEAMLSLVSTTHNLLTVDIQNLPLALPNSISIYQVMCHGIVKMGSNPQEQGFSTTFIVSFQHPSKLNVISFVDRMQWGVLS
ncbi:Nuclear transport factor 2, eukaryote,NTF2-like domain,Nuclear transport factor 2 [Cinara cedri]|uniref:NTF2-related export protein n=1 Tax=Cinara cedri TaxID=506608 RepID=A0A5E4N0V0_9HEMI|nr:Nuclear transport factor 2, eukaryote,NTF2-like domain,Nuclear transport factor 2 [Cinara cedri]